MIGWSERYACGVAVLLVVLVGSSEAAQAWCIWGLGQCETSSAPSRSSPIAGEYVRDGNPSAMLTITADKIVSKTGPVSFTVDYVVKSVEGKSVMIEVSQPEPKEIVEVQVEKDLIRIRNSQHFAGTWKKAGAKP